MALKQCVKCSETADEAKAFCPACGEPFVAEEQRQEASKFDSLEGTMQLGNTMFNMMLSDMGLNTKERTGLGQQPQVEVLKPLAPAAPPSKRAEPRPQAATPAPAAKPAGGNKWFIIGGIVIALLLLLIFMVVAFVVYQMYFR